MQCTQSWPSGFPNFKLLGKNLLRASGEKQEKFVTVDEIMITVIS